MAIQARFRPQAHDVTAFAVHPGHERQNYSQPDAPRIRQALQRARDTEDGPLDPDVAETLTYAVNATWRKIRAQPNNYVMTELEFSVFNYFQDRFRGNEIAQRAISRYWSRRQGNANGTITNGA